MSGNISEIKEASHAMHGKSDIRDLPENIMRRYEISSYDLEEDLSGAMEAVNRFDIVNEREFMKGVLVALSEVLSILSEMSEASGGDIESIIITLYDRALNGYLNIVEPQWKDALKFILK